MKTFENVGINDLQKIKAEIRQGMLAIQRKAEQEKREVTDTEWQRWNMLNIDYDDVKDKIQKHQDKQWTRAMGLEPKSQRHQAARALGNEILKLIEREAGRPVRALSSSDATGVLQDPDVQQTVIQKLISYMPFSQLGADMRIGQEQRNFARFPKVDALPGVQWVGAEGTSLTDDSSYTWGYVDLDFKTLATNVVKVSFELMDDSEIDMAAQIGDDILRAISQEVTRRVIDGATGSSQPDGILNQSGIIEVPAGGTNLATIGTRDVFVDAIEALLNRNVPLERIGILMSPEAGAQWMKTLATDNNPLESPQWIQQIVENGRLQFTTGVQNDFGAGTDETRVIIGDFSNLVIRGKQMSITLRERYADSLQYGFIGYSRWAWAVKRPDFAVITGLTEQTA